ncbi:fumarylacetoacetate hydrolase family protein [Saccharibacillus sp. CPCC 101409]|uniref:fumarylacetoacetate hydrolase family protein n=1 Tax=Saccharibacillus sp. CPCC 101409 TaxID=3058041 RepID=UPI00267307BD|nr:fumarylacetoacetate hydrolase family protein [Saccharibacillus sp. CPCC 101409]MDO3408974.1 fumarylacetoacetate hydrolase family protein [Saccharibacillus sp. CPCC 101409]
MMAVTNVYCVGRNYKKHAEELGNDVPQEPMIFLKPSHAVCALDGGTVELPKSSGEIHYETELVLRIGRAYTPGVTVDEIVASVALGIDFTLRDVQSEIKAKGHPWTAAKGFKNSAPLTEESKFPGIEALKDVWFSMTKNGETVQRGNIGSMIFDLQTLIDHIGERYGLDEGDLIYTGTPEGVGPTVSGDVLELFWNDEKRGGCTVG